MIKINIKININRNKDSILKNNIKMIKNNRKKIKYKFNNKKK